MKNLIFLSLIAIFLTACSESRPINRTDFDIADVTHEKICHTNKVRRPCSLEEEKMIDGINKIIDMIKSFDASALADEFIINQNANNPQVFLFGESHSALYGQIRSLAAINSKFKKGDILLLEGIDANRPVDDNCIYGELLQLYAIDQHLKSGGSNISCVDNNIVDFVKNNNLMDILSSTHSSYTHNLSDLAIKDLKCYGWDDATSLMNDISRSTIETRNQSMANVIQRVRTPSNQVFVTTGLMHMPLGELLSFENKITLDFFRRFDFRHRTVQEFDNYYSAIGLLSFLREQKCYLGTSKVTHDYLKNIPHGQYIHKQMLNPSFKK